MVKPIFPSQRCEEPQGPGPGPSSSRHPIYNNNPLISGHGEAIGQAGINSIANEEAFDLETFSSPFTSSHDSVFPNLRTAASPLALDVLHSQPFQPYDTPFVYAAPRERISSLPEDEEESRPIPRQRRRSAPVTMGCADDASASSASQNSMDGIPPALQDIATKGKELFWFILSEEVKAQEAVAPGSLSALTISPSSQRMEVLNERGRIGGRTLRQIAEAFSHSPQRKRVREYAETVQLENLNYNSFSDLLFGLFQEGGVTQARVLVLFFFCADVALRALRENLTKHFQQLVDWTSRYITEKLSAWVHEHGGWAAVLQESVDQVYKLAIVGVCVLSIVALSTMLWRHR